MRRHDRQRQRKLPTMKFEFPDRAPIQESGHGKRSSRRGKPSKRQMELFEDARIPQFFKEIKARISTIRSHAANDEDARAHAEEDDLHHHVLTIIAGGIPNQYVRRMAQMALESRRIKFNRWYS
jgi:hypothetical protein